MKRPLSAALFLMTFSATQAEDVAKPWAAVTFSVVETDAAATVKIEGGETLKKVNLSLIGKSLDIPEAEMAGIDHPMLDTAQLYFGEDWYGEWKEGEKPTPHFVIEMSYGERSKFGNHSTVKFLFHSGKFQERITSIQKTETVWEIITKYPGEEPIVTGTATRPPHRPAPTDEAPVE